ncbi:MULTISPECIES: oxidoreductase [unclassified Streptomyces]|uniref:oxidoreductase n=1 Tax=unclassified Streptomyces TaxID=2593676 RepID=UPI003825D48A
MNHTLTANPPWDASRLPDLSGRTAIVTGASSGLGLVTADALARAGARVVLAVRDLARGDAAAARMPGSTEVRRLDLADLASVRAFADGWSGPLDLLVNNAGVAVDRPGRTKDGFEIHFGTNHLGHFALTNRLLPHLTDRVVTVSSGAHRRADEIVYTDDPDLARGQDGQVYGRSKLANLLFTLELQRRLTEAGSPVRALAADPGLTNTNLWSQVRSPVLRLVMSFYGRFSARDAGTGALPTLYAATQDLPGASYVGPPEKGERNGGPALVGRSATAADPEVAARLWSLSEELTGVRFPTPRSR